MNLVYELPVTVTNTPKNRDGKRLWAVSVIWIHGWPWWAFDETEHGMWGRLLTSWWPGSNKHEYVGKLPPPPHFLAPHSVGWCGKFQGESSTLGNPVWKCPHRHIQIVCFTNLSLFHPSQDGNEINRHTRTDTQEWQGLESQLLGRLKAKDHFSQEFKASLGHSESIKPG